MLVVPSVVTWRISDYQKQPTVQSQMSETVQEESTEESTMTTNKKTESSLASRVYTMHKDHKPREDSGMLVGIDGFKGVTKEKIEIGLPIARMSKVKGEFHASIAVIVSIVRNDQLPGGGMVGLKTVWFSSGYKEVYRRKVNSNATFESVCNSPGNYRIYPFNIEQPLPEPEPVETTTMDSMNLTIAPELQGTAQRIAERVQLTSEQWAEAMVLERRRFAMEQKDREEHNARQARMESVVDGNTELSKENNRLLTEILQTLKELKEKW